MSDITNLPVFPHTVGNLDDRPNLSADDMKAKFEQDCMQLWEKVREAIPELNKKIPDSDIVTSVSSSSTNAKIATAKAVYDAITAALVGDDGSTAAQIISDWLTAHPEATTTVQDGAVSFAKLAAAVKNGIAPTFNTSGRYDVGEYVIYNGALYRYTSIHNPGAWDASEAETASLADLALDMARMETDEHVFRDRENYVSHFLGIIHGSVSTSAGTEGDVIAGSRRRLVTADIQVFDYPILLEVPSGYRDNTWIAYYNSNNEYTGFASVTGSDVIDKNTRFRLVIANDGDTVIKVSDSLNVTYTDQRRLRDGLSKYHTKVMGDCVYENFFSTEAKLYDMTYATVDSTGLVASRYRFASKEIITTSEAMTIAASPEFATYSWVAFYNNASDTAYATYEYLNNPIPIPSGSHIRLVLGIASGASPAISYYDLCDAVYVQKIDVREVSEEVAGNSLGDRYIKVCSYNVGKWRDGVNSGVPNEYLAAYKSRWLRLLGENNPDIICMEEALAYFDENESVTPYDTIFKQKYPYRYRFDNASGTPSKQIMICSKFPLSNPTSNTYTSGSGRAFITASASIYGTTVNFVVAHLGITKDPSDCGRDDDISQLITHMNSVGNAILCGDFNAYTISEFDPFASAGYQLSNHGDFGDYETWPTNSDWNPCLDNIITKFDIQNVYMGPITDAQSPKLSDHLPLYAEIRIKV